MSDVWNIPFIVCYPFKLMHHLRTINILFSYGVIQQRKCSCQIHSVKMPHNEHYCESSHFLDKGGDPPHSSQIRHHLPICRVTDRLYQSYAFLWIEAVVNVWLKEVFIWAPFMFCCVMLVRGLACLSCMFLHVDGSWDCEVLSRGTAQSLLIGCVGRTGENWYVNTDGILCYIPKSSSWQTWFR